MRYWEDERNQQNSELETENKTTKDYSCALCKIN